MIMVLNSPGLLQISKNRIPSLIPHYHLLCWGIRNEFQTYIMAAKTNHKLGLAWNLPLQCSAKRLTGHKARIASMPTTRPSVTTAAVFYLGQNLFLGGKLCPKGGTEDVQIRPNSLSSAYVLD
ncbi:hypothetical protein VNO77_00333 [Canavalia gladiata]|uniref:Uncharacterized protein n=1 Tax=Canavalia gladiata TaxID=3824 RepID=A0AAN9MQY1_CANGL